MRHTAGVRTPTVNYVAGQTRGNNAVVMLGNGQLETLCRPTGATHVIIE